jgi:Na+/melibiose symporter-like transporter
MATDAAFQDVGALAAATPAPLAPAVRWRILLYLAGLIVLMGFASPSGGLIGLPISFFLKNKLHLKAHEVALFGLIAAIPVYLSFAFGFARDRFNPLGMRDRGFLVVFGAMGAAVCLAFASRAPTYGTLLAAFLLLSVAYLFIASALRGLTSTIGQQHVMSGQVSAVWNLFEALPAIAALVAGGVLSQLLEGEKAARGARILFLVGAAIMALIAVYGLFKPASVFGNVRSERLSGARPLDDLKRLVRHRPIYPALLIGLLWSFVPGFTTPLQYFFQNTLHGDDAQFGQWGAIYLAAYLPTYLLYGVLCRRFALRALLLWGTVAALPMMVPLLFIHSVTGALIAAAPIGLMGGVATAAYFDLLIRSCPPGLQGTVLMTAFGLSSIDLRFGDVLGTNLYDHFGGFTVCVIAMTITNALILPALLLVPKDLTATADG